jgi:23S rRNA A2030 N6-methylase RlmJ
MLVVNPPFGFEQEARSMLKWLQPVLSREDGGSQRVVWLAGE